MPPESGCNVSLVKVEHDKDYIAKRNQYAVIGAPEYEIVIPRPR